MTDEYIWDYVVAIAAKNEDFSKVADALITEELTGTPEEIQTMSDNVKRFSEIILLAMIEAHGEFVKDKLSESAKILKEKAKEYIVNDDMYFATASLDVRGKFMRTFA